MGGAKSFAEESLGFLLGRAIRALKNQTRRRFREAGHDISMEQWVAMVFLAREGPINQQELADQLGVDKTAISRLLHGMESRCLIRRLPSETSKRELTVILDEKGERLFQELSRVAGCSIDDASRGIPMDQINCCKSVLRRLYANIQNPDDPAAPRPAATGTNMRQ